MPYKFCKSCNKSLSTDEFAKNSSKKDGLQSSCRSCKSEQQKKWYQSNLHTHRANVRRRNKDQIASLRSYVIGYLKEHPCVDCGESRLETLDFDHITGFKLNSVSRLVRGGVSLVTLQNEIAKCQVVCSNCHRIRTYGRAGWKKI